MQKRIYLCLAHHRNCHAVYKEQLSGIPGLVIHGNPSERYDSNFWLNTLTLNPAIRVKGQEDAYRRVVKEAVGGVASVLHSVSIPVTDCQPNDNVEALRVSLDRAGIESRPLCKPMHRQPVFRNAPAYVNGVSEALFKVGLCLPSGPCVSDEELQMICDTIKESLE